jgi:hypothetical protein
VRWKEEATLAPGEGGVCRQIGRETGAAQTDYLELVSIHRSAAVQNAGQRSPADILVLRVPQATCC